MSEVVYGRRVGEGPFLGWQPRPPKPPKRKCTHAGCVTILCRYNAGPRCFVHSSSGVVLESADDVAALMAQRTGVGL